MAEVVTFCFGDLNPLTGVSYGRSRFCERPGFAAEVVATGVGMHPETWDGLVAMDATDVLLRPTEGWQVDRVELDRADAATLHYGELAMAVAWSGEELPRRLVTPDDALSLAALGVIRHGVPEIRAAHQNAHTLRESGQPRKASELYGGVRRERLAHAVAHDLVAPAPSPTPPRAKHHLHRQPRLDHDPDAYGDTDTIGVIGW